MKDFFPLKIGEETELHVLEEQHSPELFKLVDSSRSHLRPWLPFVDRYQTVSEATAFIRRFQEKASKKDGLALGIRFKGNLGGVITYDYFDWSNRATLIGFWLGEPFQGKGLMTKACSALVNVAFQEMNLNRVEIGCASENARCRAIPERLGFKQEGILRQREQVHDHFVDIVVYSMLVGDWQEKSS